MPPRAPYGSIAALSARTCPHCADTLRRTHDSLLWCSCGHLVANQGGVTTDAR